MSFTHFDYGYNMKVNIAAGVANGLGWLIWFVFHRNDGIHIFKRCLSILLLGCSVSLEILDFPPIWWTLDSHALWHFATALIPLLWFQFALEDTKLLIKSQHLKEE